MDPNLNDKRPVKAIVLPLDHGADRYLWTGRHVLRGGEEKNSGELPVNNIYGTESKSSSSSAGSNAVKATPTYGPSEGVSSLKSFVSTKGSSSSSKEASRLRAILEDLKIQLRQRGAKGFIGSQLLGVQERNERDLQLLFKFFDADGSGMVDFNELLYGLKGPMSDRRAKLVDLAFDRLDRSGNGLLEPDDIIGVYDSSRHPDVLTGRRSADEVLKEFLDTFDIGGVHDGKVTREEFHNYYSNIGASIDNEDYFELMIRNAWHISGGEGAAANSANRRVLVTRADGSEYVEEIKNDLGLRADDKAGMMDRLRAQGVTNAASISTYDSVGTKKKDSQQDQQLLKSKSPEFVHKDISRMDSDVSSATGDANLAPEHELSQEEVVTIHSTYMWMDDPTLLLCALSINIALNLRHATTTPKNILHLVEKTRQRSEHSPKKTNPPPDKNS
eukprot:gene26256-34880_t